MNPNATAPSSAQAQDAAAGILASLLERGFKRTHALVCLLREMAADPLMVALLVGLGFRAFSMTPAAIPVVKRGLRAVDSREAVRLAREALVADSAEDVHVLLAPLAAAMTEEGQEAWSSR